MRYETPIMDVFMLEEYDIIKTSNVGEGSNADQIIPMGVNFAD